MSRINADGKPSNESEYEKRYSAIVHEAKDESGNVHVLRPFRTRAVAAMWYASIGLKVFPVWWLLKGGRCACETECGDRAGKHPVPQSGQHEATADLAQIEAWWADYPEAHIGIALAASGLVAVDIDPDKGGNETFARLETQHGSVVSTWTQRSGSGGRHIVFRCDPAADLAGRLGDGVDVKHEGYIVAAPSGHRSGNSYAWEKGQSPFDLMYDRDIGADGKELVLPPLLPKWIVAVPKGGASVNDKTIRDALKRFREEEPETLPTLDYPGLQAKDEEFAGLMTVTAPADYSTYRYNLAKCLCREFVRGGFTAWHLRDFYLDWEGAGVYVDGRQHGTGEFNDRDIVREFERNKEARPLTMGEAFVAVTDDEETYGKAAHEVKTRLKVNTADVHGTSVKIVNILMKRGVELYQRGGRLVSVVVREPPKGMHVIKKVETAQIIPVEIMAFLDIVSSHIDFVAPSSNGGKELQPPRLILDVILATVLDRPFPEITAVYGSPILRPDGTIVSRRGYDAGSGIFLTETLDLPPLPERPTKDDALAALDVLLDLIEEFPFETDAHRSVALSAILSTCMRASYPVVPACIMSAPTPGTGKSFLIDLVGLIATGRPVAAMPAGRDEAETEKRLDAALLRGLPIIGIDNMNGTIGGDKLCQAIERPMIDVRPLGRSIIEEIVNTFALFGNGNNIELSIDIARRCLLCRLDANVELTYTRSFAKRPDEMVRQDRGRYVAAVLTIIKAWRLARDTGQRPLLPRLASFEAWSDEVGSALVWLGRTDPLKTMEEGRETDPGLIARQSIFPAWHQLLGEGAYTVQDVIDKATADEIDVLGGVGLMSILQAHLPETRRNDTGGDVRRLAHISHRAVVHRGSE